eukprot:g1343.t1
MHRDRTVNGANGCGLMLVEPVRANDADDASTVRQVMPKAGAPMIDMDTATDGRRKKEINLEIGTLLETASADVPSGTCVAAALTVHVATAAKVATAAPDRRLAGDHAVESCCGLSDPSSPPFQLVASARPPAGGRLPSPFGVLVWLPLATVQPLTEADPSAAAQSQVRVSLPATSTAMVPREQRRLAGEYVVEEFADEPLARRRLSSSDGSFIVESYDELKSLAACPDNSNAACDFSGKAIIVRCDGKVLDANLENRIFYGKGSGSSLQVHGCVLARGKSGFGGAIMSWDVLVTIFSSVFNRNQAGIKGGALYVKGSLLELRNCSAADNGPTASASASFKGGFLYAQDDAYNKIEIYDSQFATNGHELFYLDAQSDSTKAAIGQYNALELHSSSYSAPITPTPAPFVGKNAKLLQSFCHVCPGGYYKRGDDNDCIACGAGKYVAAAGSDNATDCISCRAGTYQSSSGASACIKCSAGLYAAGEGSTSVDNCTACPAGKHQSSRGQSLCKSCEAGKYGTTIGSSSGADCIACGAGKYVAAAGADNETDCISCRAGTYQEQAAQTSCVKCDAGKHAPDPESKLASMCKYCPSGKFQSSQGQSVCGSCAPGQYQMLMGMHSCTSCDVGMYQRLSAQRSCAACEAGRYQAQDSQAFCTVCDGGRYSAATASTTCIDCGVGKYSSSSSTVCTSCEAGKVQGLTGQSSCDQCNGASNQYQNETGRTSCKTCALCPAGARKGCGGSSKGYCADCIPGQYVNSSDCAVCPAGYYQSATNEESCAACEAGRYQARDSQAFCTVCDGGRYSAAMASTACTDCGAGKYSSSSSTVCTSCEAGKVQGRAAQSSCNRCNGASNQYQNETGRTSCKTCAACPAGARKGCGGSSAGYCADCIPGQYIDAASSSCADCPAGEYSSTKNQKNCTACEAGRYQTKRGQSYCKEMRPCIPGTYDRSNGTNTTADRCAECPEQYFQTELNRDSCIACEPGRYQNKKGKSFCDQVPSDKARRKVELPSGKVTYDLVECKAGTMAKDMECRECPMGKVQPDAGKSACVQCLSEQYIRLNSTTRKPDRQHCDACPRPGAACNGANKTYKGNFWHEPSVLNPNASTNMYACVNDGCPDEGEREMRCKDGYEGPLCATCSEGYFPQLRKCTDCGGAGPSLASVAFFGVSLLCVLGLVVAVYRHRRFLASTGVFAHVKILVSFVTIMLTVDRQFGVTWPPAFQRALTALSVLSLDFGILGSLLCMFNLSFYANLLCTTLLLVALLFCIFVSYLCLKLHRPDQALETKQTCLFVAIYLLLFGYPVVSVKVVELFGCHNVDGTFYLRADYSLECYTSEW